VANKNREVRMGPFIVMDELPGGHNTRVFRARYRPEEGAPIMPLEYGTVVVIKLLKRESRNVEKAKKRLARETELLTLLDHPGISRAISQGRTGSSAWLATEYIEGDTLQRVRDAFIKADYRLQPQVALTLFADLAEALAKIHFLEDRQGSRMGLIHRDLAPQNLMLDIKGQARVVNFGSALKSKLSEGKEGDANSGTLGYLSPEQARAEILTQSSDVYTLGVLFFEMLTGVRAFEVEHKPPNAALEGHQKARGGPWPDNCDVSSRVRLIVDQCLSPDPAMRPQNGAELSGMLGPMVRDPNENHRRLALVARDLVMSNRERPVPLYV